MTIREKADRLLSEAPVGGGDEALFAAISRYEEARAAKWAVLARDHYTDDEHNKAGAKEHTTFNYVADFPATTLTGLLAKMLIVLEDMGRPGAEYDFANVSYSCEDVIDSLIADLQRQGIEWTPRGEPTEWAATVNARVKPADDGELTAEEIAETEADMEMVAKTTFEAVATEGKEPSWEDWPNIGTTLWAAYRLLPYNDKELAAKIKADDLEDAFSDLVSVIPGCVERLEAGIEIAKAVQARLHIVLARDYLTSQDGEAEHKATGAVS